MPKKLAAAVRAIIGTSRLLPAEEPDEPPVDEPAGELAGELAEVGAVVGVESEPLLAEALPVPESAVPVASPESEPSVPEAASVSTALAAASLRVVTNTVPLAAMLLLASSTWLVYAAAALAVYGMIVAQLIGVAVVVVVTGPVQMGQPAQVDRRGGAIVPPTQQPVELSP